MERDSESVRDERVREALEMVARFNRPREPGPDPETETGPGIIQKFRNIMQGKHNGNIRHGTHGNVPGADKPSR